MDTNFDIFDKCWLFDRKHIIIWLRVQGYLCCGYESKQIYQNIFAAWDPSPHFSRDIKECSSLEDRASGQTLLRLKLQVTGFGYGIEIMLLG